jgi:hypothetical protein
MGKLPSWEFVTIGKDVPSAGFLRQANLNDSAKNRGFNENSGDFELTWPAYFA